MIHLRNYLRLTTIDVPSGQPHCIGLSLRAGPASSFELSKLPKRSPVSTAWYSSASKIFFSACFLADGAGGRLPPRHPLHPLRRGQVPVRRILLPLLPQTPLPLPLPLPRGSEPEPAPVRNLRGHVHETPGDEQENDGVNGQSETGRVSVRRRDATPKNSSDENVRLRVRDDEKHERREQLI